MLSTARTVVRRGAIGLAGTAAVGTTAATAYVYTDDGSRRQARFWSKVFPIVADYYIHTAQSSPYVKLQDYMLNNDGTEDETSDGDKEEQRKRRKKGKLDELHERHAPDILQVMLDLKGLYVKLGQVLSVTALPVPEPYRVKFRTLQSDVPGWEEFEDVVKPTLEKEFGRPLEEIFEYVDPIPCGAASIGQAHKARLKAPETGGSDKSRDVIVKVQYPAASWQVPADIECVGDFLKICVYFGVVDEESAKMSYDEFSRQFLAELDYNRERENLQLVYESSLDPSAPYQKRGVVIPKPYDELCTGKVITMSYLPGPKLEEEAKRQLESLGIDTSGGISQIIKDAAKDAADNPDEAESGELVRRVTRRIDEAHHSPFSWKITASRIFSQVFGFDSILWAVRAARRVVLWSQAGAVACIQSVPQALVSQKWAEWADAHQTALAQAQRLSLTAAWIDALFDVHGHQVFTLGAFNSDPHPGNILVIEEEDGKPSTRLGLIDYGCVFGGVFVSFLYFCYDRISHNSNSRPIQPITDNANTSSQRSNTKLPALF